MENKIKLLLILLLVIVAFVLGYFFGQGKFAGTGKVVQDIGGNYSYTKAVCSDGGKCIDVLIECENNKVVSLKPMSDLVQINMENKIINNSKLC